MIETYQFGKIVIDGKTYTADVIIFPDSVQENWWRKSGHNLSPEDLQTIFLAKPNLLIIGTGYSGLMKVPTETIKIIHNKNIDLIIDKTRNAVARYNKEILLNKKVIAAFHLTC